MEMIKIKDVKLVDIKSIKLNPNNRNSHPQEQIEELARHYEVHGMRTALTISNQSGLCVAGEGRYLAAIRAGLTQVPVSFQDFDTPELEYAYGVADNGLSMWSELDFGKINADIIRLGEDFDLRNLGLKDFTLDAADKEGLTDEDAVPEVGESRVVLGDVWQLGEHRLMCGDSTSIDAVEKLMGGEKADMVFTDPPYGIEVVSKGNYGKGVLAKAATYSPVIGDENTDVAKDCIRMCLSFDFPIMIFWGANYYASSLPDSQKWIVWDKKRPSGTTFSDVELAWTNLDGNLKKYEFLWHGMMQEGSREKRVHPTQKPVGLISKIFEDIGAASVIDFFGGSGSTLIACEKTNRKCFMMELDPHYCEVILKRWEDFTGKQAVKL